MSNDISLLIQQGEINSIKVKNRIVMSSAITNMAARMAQSRTRCVHIMLNVGVAVPA